MTPDRARCHAGVRQDGGTRGVSLLPPGEYVVGWIKRGPSGVIGTNKKDAGDTVARILEDVAAGAVAEPDPARANPDAVGAWIAERAPQHVTWDGWGAIDAYETALGSRSGRPRVKLVRTSELCAVAAKQIGYAELPSTTDLLSV